MSVKERFLRYVKIHTTSDETTHTSPSFEGEWQLASLLCEELNTMGIQAHVTSSGIVYGVIPAKGRDTEPAIGLIAHMDTSNAVPGETNPQIIDRYKGGSITLKNGILIDASDIPTDLIGQELIVTDGNSVLGADDKAGVAEIMETASRLVKPDAPNHPRICIAFTPDEEIGEGVDHFDVEQFGADYAYTVDGGALGEIEYDNFNAASCRVQVRGLSYHPGSAKNKMKNAGMIANKFIQMLPEAETPEHTEGREGFFHLIGFHGDVELAELIYIIRDHDMKKFTERKEKIQLIADYLNSIYGPNTVKVEIKDSYFNMLEVIEKHMDIVEKAEKAFELNGIPSLSCPIRGGTDGARLSFMGLPCPNLSTGGYNFHSRKEFIPTHALQAMCDMLFTLVTM